MRLTVSTRPTSNCSAAATSAAKPLIRKRPFIVMVEFLGLYASPAQHEDLLLCVAPRVHETARVFDHGLAHGHIRHHQPGYAGLPERLDAVLNFLNGRARNDGEL